MADYSEVLRLFPAARHYVRQRRWARRGDVLAYAAHVETDVFSTDAYGFRYGDMDGQRYGLATALSGGPYGLMLGASNVFGFGLESDSQTIPSRLSQLSGLPCLNVSFPEADLRTLHSAATRIVSETPRMPAFIVCFAGGTLSRYGYGRRCDPLFGSPDSLTQNAGSPPCGTPEEAAAFANLLGFTRFWLEQISALAGRCGCPLALYDETSAFEKTRLNEEESACALTQPGSEDRERFATHRLRYTAFRQNMLMAARNGILVVSGTPDELSFIDEFHYTAAASERIARDIARSLQCAGDRGVVDV